MSRTPTGPAAPASGWHVDLADGFDAPLGTGPGQDDLWYPGPGWDPRPSVDAAGNNGYETQVFNSSQVAVTGGDLVLSARYANDVAPATGNADGLNVRNRVQRTYVAGEVSSPTDHIGYKGFNWTPGDGSTWAFEIDCRFPVNTGGLFNAWWSSSQGNWTDERDFFEAHDAARIDTDWLFNTSGNGARKSDYYINGLSFDPSAAMHRYTYVVHPDQSWSLYVDGALQTWVGDKGVAPPETSGDTPMELIIDYALDGTSFTTGKRSFAVNSVAVYQDNAHAGRSTRGGGIAPGTVLSGPG